MNRCARLLGVLSSLVFAASASQAAPVDPTGDGALDGADVAYMKAHFYGDDARADLNGDGVVNFADLALLKAAFGNDSFLMAAGTQGGMDVFVSMSPATQAVSPGQRFTLDVFIDFSNDPALGGGIDIIYNPAVLGSPAWTFDSSTIVDDPDFRREPDFSDGLMSGIATGNFNGLPDPGIIGSVSFDALQPAVTEVVPADSVYAWVSAINFLVQEPIYAPSTVSVSGTPQPNIDVTPPVANFPPTSPGNQREIAITVTNTGFADLDIGPIGGADALDPPFFILADTCSLQTLAIDANCELTVRFAPDSEADNTDSFDIPSNDPDLPSVSVPVAGSSIPIVPPLIELLPVTQDAPLGQIVSIDVAMDFSGDPTGNGGMDIAYDADALAFVEWTFATSTIVDDPSERRSPDTLPGLLSDIRIGAIGGVAGPGILGTATFLALQSGVTDLTPSDSAFGWTSEDTGFQQFPDYRSASVSVVVDADIAVTPNPAVFENERVGQAESLDIVVTNSGSLDLVLGPVAATDMLDPPFSIVGDGCSSAILTPAGSCTINARFAPVARGLASDSFDIPSGDPDTPVVTVSVEGRGQTVGVQVIGAPPLIGRCRNLTSGERLDFAAGGMAVDCEAAGLAVASGDRVSTSAAGRATGATLIGLAGGILEASIVVRCRNRSTAQEITFLTADPTINCVGQGLGVSAGDDVIIVVRGEAL